MIVRALHAPGHRPEHTAFALVDRARGAEPWAVLSPLLASQGLPPARDRQGLTEDASVGAGDC